MARRETVVYECDWCKVTSLEGVPHPELGTKVPANWGYVDWSHEMLCPTCRRES